jgi:hypothetical protein
VRSLLGRCDVPKCFWLRPRLRYLARLRQPLALDWMAAPLRHDISVKTDLSSPSREPETNWRMVTRAARRLTGTLRGIRCVSRARRLNTFAGSLSGALNLV